MASILLKAGRERSLLRRHPWVFSGAIERIEGAPAPGETVEVRGADGAFLARGAFSPGSQIAVRVWTFEEGEAVDAGFIRARIARAAALRDAGPAAGPRPEPAGVRLVNAESDGFPGLVVDRYGEALVCQFTSAGAERWKGEATAALAALRPGAPILERSEGEARAKEGLPPSVGPLAGSPPERVEIVEGACRFVVDIRAGHKTGFYLDQRENRAALSEYARGAEVLDAFAYSGAFGIAALHAGAARLTQVEASEEALALARRNLALNGFDAATVATVQGDVFSVLRGFRDARRSFDLIVLDPPKFAASRAQVEGAARGYKDINLLALKLLRPGGVLFTFSCSGAVDAALFEKIVAAAALDAKRDVQVLRRLGPAADHPVSLTFPEGAYLKGLVCRAL